MRRSIGWVASLVIAAGLAVAPGAAATASAPAACTGTVQITSLAFSPPSIPAGRSSTATLHARNCTAQTLKTTTTWYGQFTGASVGVPPGCPVIDPLPKPATFAPHGTVTLSTSYLVFASCAATSLHLTVKITGADGTLLATGTATLAIHP